MVGEKQVMADKVWSIERQIANLQAKKEAIWDASVEVEARVAKAREEVDRSFGGSAWVDKKMEEEKKGVDKGEVWQQGDLLVDVGLPPATNWTR